MLKHAPQKIVKSQRPLRLAVQSLRGRCEFGGCKCAGYSVAPRQGGMPILCVCRHHEVWHHREEEEEEEEKEEGEEEQGEGGEEGCDVPN